MSTTDHTVADTTTEEMGGGYDVLRQRLNTQADALAQKALQINQTRLAEFGQTDFKLLTRFSARTENNCVARDIVRIGDQLLFGYNVFIGLRKETHVDDVFALYTLQEKDGSVDLLPLATANSFLADSRFTADFRELYAYYKNASLTQLRVRQQKLLAAFQIGQNSGDVRVFRWAIDNDHRLTYIDNRGERDMALPQAYDFEWVATTREQHVLGRFPHINILDTIFVETVSGDLTVKIENNTESGLGIYSEVVDDKNQSLADADIAYAKLGALILLRIKPYREDATRYLVFNARTNQVVRIDAIGKSCVQLPEDHGIIFPGGYLLQSGEFKLFDLPAGDCDGLRFKRMIKAPNGEDFLYIFYDRERGGYGLFSYNLIDKTLATPLLVNSYTGFDDGRFLLFQSERDEPTRSHTMQLWQTPFVSDEFARQKSNSQSYMGRIGNAELVRGISALTSIGKAIREQNPTRVAYEDLMRQCQRTLDAYFWLEDAEVAETAREVKAIITTARATLDEFDKVQAIKREAARLLQQANSEQQQLLNTIASSLWQQPDDFVRALAQLQAQRGRLMALKEQRYIDLAQIEALDLALAQEEQRLGERTIQFLSQAQAFSSYRKNLISVEQSIASANNSHLLDQQIKALDDTGSGLDLLTNLMAGLNHGDAATRAQILEQISAIYGDVNRLRAQARNRRKTFVSAEAASEFGAQLRLYNQSIESALELSVTPERCDDALTRLLARLEEIEGTFSEHDNFISEIANKREQVYEVFGAHKQSLLDARTKRSQSLVDAGLRILQGVPKRVAQLKKLDEVHAYFASDPLLAKVRQLISDLRELKANVAADDLDTQFKTARDSAIRVVRDQQDLISGGGDTIRFGRFAFTINRQALDLTLLPRNDGLCYHLTSTDYFAEVNDDVLNTLKPYWSQTLISESTELSRAEYLAGLVFASAQRGELEASLLELTTLALKDDDVSELQEIVRQFAAPRFNEGYQKGVHDHDAALILQMMLRLSQQAGLLRYGPRARALACLWWSWSLSDAQQQRLLRMAKRRAQLRLYFGNTVANDDDEQHWLAQLTRFASDFSFLSGQDTTAVLGEALHYVLDELAQDKLEFVCSVKGDQLAQQFTHFMQQQNVYHEWQKALHDSEPIEKWQGTLKWLHGFVTVQQPASAIWLDEAATLLCLTLPRVRRNAELDGEITGILSEMPTARQGVLQFNLNDFNRRFRHHQTIAIPAFQQLTERRQQLLQQQKALLRMEQFRAKPLSSFVRNKLIDEVYLPLVGDNLAKQIGAAGDSNRSDRMGMLLLISPPGYGKTTLMEYIADRLGLIFVRINCPALGHDVTSLDPSKAPHSAARTELEKLNLGLAMGNNVVLYLDDIQHTNPEFLQKFISLSDGTRRIEGVWNGEARSYDLRGKRFAIVMAGNPYTESGDVFKIPDMLANRADIYNLGDVLSGREKLFALSYIENSLTANPATLPLSTRDPKDIDRFVRLAEGEDVPATEFLHVYSAAERSELVALFKHLFVARDVLLKVNLTYIHSAAQDDHYRTEPPFKLQGSYRNMTKLAGKITAAMQASELDALIRDHYRGEAQTLTSGAEENLLKLAQLLGSASAEEEQRWQAIVAQFATHQAGGGDDVDGVTRIGRVLAEMSGHIKQWQTQPSSVAVEMLPPDDLVVALNRLTQLYEQALLPLVTATHHKMKLDHSIWDKLRDLNREMAKLGVVTDNEMPVDGEGASSKKAEPKTSKSIKRKE